LLTVSADGSVQKRASCIPLVQQIPETAFKDGVRELPIKMRRRLAESFEHYQQDAVSGVRDITELMEGLVLKCGRDAVTKKWIQPNDAKPGYPAATLTALATTPQGKSIQPAIGGTQSYISEYRNTAHHFPKNRKQAHRKYRDCRHAFLDGIKRICAFRAALKNIGLSGNL
jgi:hypothetical protein